MYTIAFHGKPGSAALLKRDCGNPNFISSYFNGFNVEDAMGEVQGKKGVVLIGYSYGGQFIAELTNHLDNIRGVVLYEAPLFSGTSIRGGMPCLMIWNKNGRRNWKSAKNAEKKWTEACSDIKIKEYDGRHFKFVWGCPPIGHGWNVEANDEIKSFLWKVERNGCSF